MGHDNNKWNADSSSRAHSHNGLGTAAILKRILRKESDCILVGTNELRHALPKKELTSLVGSCEIRSKF